MTKRLGVGTVIELRNNAAKEQVTVVEVKTCKGSQLSIMIASIMSEGSEGEELGIDCETASDVVAWLTETQPGMSCHELVAFRVETSSAAAEAADNAEAPVEGAPEATPPRRQLKARPSDVVDVSDPSLRSKYREVTTQFRKKGLDVASYDWFPSLAAEVLRPSTLNELSSVP